MQCPLCGSRTLMRDYASARGYALVVFGALLLVLTKFVLPAIQPLFLTLNGGNSSTMIFTDGIDYAIKQLFMVGVISSFFGVFDIAKNQNKFCLACGFKGRFHSKKFDAKTSNALESFKATDNAKSNNLSIKNKNNKISPKQPILPLIKMLSLKNKSKRDDALNTLKYITGKNFGENQERWEQWHNEKNKADKDSDNE